MVCIPAVKKQWRRYSRHKHAYLMLVPGVLFFGIFCYAPMCGLVIAFKNYSMTDGIIGSSWCGLDNFARLFLGGDFWKVLANTLTISILRLVCGFSAPIILALMLNELRIRRYARGVQTLTYLPYFFSWVTLSGIFLMVFSLGGPINEGISKLGFERIEFLTSDGWFIAILIITYVWKGIGYGAVIYLAALAGIPGVLYEAAVVDGAGRWKQMLHITLPCLVPTIITLFILNLGQVLNAGFDQIYNLYNPMVYDVADILDTYILRRMQFMDFGLATSAGMLKSVVSMLLIVMANALANRLSHGEQGVY